MNTIPYTYLIGWPHLNIWYYGVRFQKNCNPTDFWVSYFTSSKHVKKFIKENGNPDIRIIRKTFLDSKSARYWEHKVLRRLNARDDHRFLNKTNGDGRFFNLGHTEETKKRLSEKHTGKKLSEETKQKLSIVNKGRLAGERNGMFGKTHSEEAKKKISESVKNRSVWFQTGKTYEEIQKDPISAQQRKEKHRQRMKENHPFRGKNLSEDHKRKLSEARKNKIKSLTDEGRKQLLGHNKGKPWSEARRLAQLNRKK